MEMLLEIKQVEKEKKKEREETNQLLNFHLFNTGIYSLYLTPLSIWTRVIMDHEIN